TYKSGLPNALELKIGGLYRHKQRNNYQNQYNQFAVGGNNSIGSRQQFSDIYSARDSIINPNGSAVYDLNDYQAFENVASGYGLVKLILFKQLDVVGGARMESTTQGYHFLRLEYDAVDHVSKQYTDLLPSLSLKYRLDPLTNLRASYFKSLSRPGYYEVLPVSQALNSAGQTQKGNPDLQHTTADNFDIRWEHFPTSDQQIFVGGFYKKLQNPIELAYSGLDTFKPENSASATIYGAEVIYSRFFGSFGVTGNYAYTHSDVNGKKIDPATGQNTYQHRPLQGQPDHELNLSLEYRNEHRNFFVQLSYQYNGKTLYQINPDLGYDYYQQPQSFLALSADKTLNKHWTLFGKFNNLLNTPTTIRIGQLLTGQDYAKASGLIGIRYSH
ncbi:MAG TPA: TonB-dependent receptor, partial [Mucilaginibacter sp.]|nr:TonB-dependent receptor [Mucilaginibacter sp.]